MKRPTGFEQLPWGLSPARSEGAVIGPDDPLHYPQQAFDDFEIPFGHTTTDAEGKRWVFCGWAQTTVSKEAYFVRELQPGERLSPVNPYGYHCTTTEALLRKFPLLTYVRK